MRKVVTSELVSLDGVMENPQESAFSYCNDDMEEANSTEMADSDALLLGRLSYQVLGEYQPG